MDVLVARVFWVALVLLLAGYMFFGRGFAHLAVGPIYIGDVVLALGLVSVTLALLGANRARAFAQLRHPHPVIVLLVAFMLLGAARTVPYLPADGINAIRDAVLWGYAAFALIIYVLADRANLEMGLRAYASIAPVFALWLPVSWWIWITYLAPGVSSSYPQANIPFVFFKSQDMAVHAVAALTFTIIAAGTVRHVRSLLVAFVVAIPLVWSLFLTSVASRGALLAIVGAIGMTALWVHRPAKWVHAAAAGALVVALTTAPAFLAGAGGTAVLPTSSAVAGASPTSSAVAGASPTSSAVAGASPTSSSVAGASPTSSAAAGASPTAITEPSPPPGRGEFTVGQVVENFTSVFGDTSNQSLDGTRSFRLAWWTKIVGYTVFGPFFWTGKGFGVNLADDDGFQPTLDNSLRAPHNSHITTLARMGVPGFVLWAVLQLTWVLALAKAIWRHRRNRDEQLMMAGVWILVYWVAIAVNTSFDPYIEGPQGGIWFWVVFGAGLVVMQAKSRPGAKVHIPLLGQSGWAFRFRRRDAPVQTPERPE